MAVIADELRLAQALEWVQQNPRNSVNQAAIRFNIPRTTLRRRAAGGRNRLQSHVAHQLLLEAEESELAEAVLAHADRGFPVRIQQLKSWALAIVRTRRPEVKTIGVHWPARFLHRNPRVTIRWRQNMDSLRMKAASPESLTAFYETVHYCFHFVDHRLNGSVKRCGRSI
jgi:hypothetical protein